MPILQRAIELWYHDPACTTPVLKLMAELVHNRYEPPASEGWQGFVSSAASAFVWVLVPGCIFSTSVYLCCKGCQGDKGESGILSVGKKI